MEDDQLIYQNALKVKSHGRVVVVTADSPKHLSKPFLRIQENYEGRKFKGQQVSFARFKSWYKQRRKTTAFTYYDDWQGFNFPGQAVLDFVSLYGGKENEAEKVLLSKLDFPEISDRYIIGLLEGDTGTLLHEMAHALFHLDSVYRTQVLAFLSRMEYLDELNGVFAKSDYHNSVWLDEMQAYLIAGIGDLDVHGKPMTDIEKFDQIVKEIKSIFDAHVKKYPEIVALI